MHIEEHVPICANDKCPWTAARIVAAQWISPLGGKNEPTLSVSKELQRVLDEADPSHRNGSSAEIIFYSKPESC